jgi:hypothetical protein
MMIDPNRIEAANERYRRLLREAEIHRLVNAGAPPRRRRRVLVLVRVGDLLISLGVVLKARYQAASN